MNSAEQRFLNAMYDHSGKFADPVVIGDKAGFTSGQVRYYIDKWTQRGWYDPDNERLTPEAPARTETVRSALEKQGFDPLDRSRGNRAANNRSDGFRTTELPSVDAPRGGYVTPKWAVVVTPDLDGLAEFLNKRGGEGKWWLHAKNTEDVIEFLDRFGRHLPVALGPRWYHNNVAVEWFDAQGIRAEAWE